MYKFRVVKRRLFNSFLVVSALIAQVNPAFGQDFGRFRPGIQWQQLNTPAVRVIFPHGLEAQASRVASTISYLNANSSTTIGPATKKLDLILNNEGILSNGYVTLMPYRSEFFTTPMQDGFALGTLPWLDLLSVHEYRHALQYINLRQGFTRAAWLLFGDAGWGTVINLTTPGWFFEGDAVATETALTGQGRGRMPSFLQLQKSILLNDKKYSYMKARNGSYRDQVPDIYELGYLLCSYGREHYGNDLWPKVIRQTAQLKGIIYPFSDAVEAYTGLNTRRFYRKALSDFKETWSTEDKHTYRTPFTPLIQPSRTVTDYRFPVYQPNGDLLVYSSSYREPGAIYRVEPDGLEDKVCNTGLAIDPYFTASGNLLSWAEVTWDERYEAQSYSDVVTFRMDTRQKVYLTRHQRFFSPALSPDGSQILVVEVDAINRCRLKILNSTSGEEIVSLPNADDLYYTYPKWDLDGQHLISSARTANGNMLIIRQSIESGTINKLTGEYQNIIGEVLVTQESILFTAGFSGINNVYSLSRTAGQLTQLTSSRFGAYYPAMSNDGKQLAYTDFDIKGYGLVTVSMDSLLTKPVRPVAQDSIPSLDFDYLHTSGDRIPPTTHEALTGVQPYKTWQHPFRIHSWTFTPDFYSASLALISDNILNNLHLEAGASYYYNEKTPGIAAEIRYGGFYPILSASLSRVYRHPAFTSVLLGEETSEPLGLDHALSLDAEVPLNFSRGEFYRTASIGLGYSFISQRDLRAGNNETNDLLTLHAATGTAAVSITRKKARQNITTPLGIGLELSVKQSIGSTSAAQYQGIADLALRGLFPNHNLLLTAGLKIEPDGKDYQFIDQFLYPRGFAIPALDRMLTIQSSYHFPIAYPDLGFWGIFYCSRIRADVFADGGFASVSSGSDAGSRMFLASVGTELIFDTTWFNIAEIPLGVRFSLLLTPDPGKMRWEVVVPVLRL